MHILGLDPGYRFTGYGIIEQLPGQKPVVVRCGRICLDKIPSSQKMFKLYAYLNALACAYSLKAAVIEDIFLSRNVQTTIKMGKIIGVAQCALFQKCPVYFYAPAEVKKIVANSGAASKSDIQKSVLNIISTTSRNISSTDAYDALAVALAYIIST